jgi:outer membrane lipoprotein carrier protein
VFIATAAGALELDRAATAMAGQQAAFTHLFTPKGFRKPQTESGTVTFGRLPMMRWSYTKPESKLFVFDGTKSWFYIPADKQVTVGVVDDARKRELPFLLLGDTAARDRHFAVKETTRGNKVLTTLAAKDSRALVRSVTVSIDARTHLISGIDYTDRDGNKTSFVFSGYHAQPASADTFRFNPPAGVQVINAE